MLSSVFSFLKMPLYQTAWNGISLAEVAAVLGKSPAEVAGPEFYDAFYASLRRNGYSISPEWRDAKLRMSMRVRQVLNETDPRWREQNRVALAVGVGLGIIEIPLLADGYRIHLQECQQSSLGYFDVHSTAPAEKIFITRDISALPSGSYDAVYINQVVYAFGQLEYGNLLKGAYTILKPGGLLAIWDPECPFGGVLRANARHPGVFWGWLRSGWLHAALAREAGFSLKRVCALSSTFEPIDSQKMRFAGCILPHDESIVQELIFQKPF